MVRHQTIRTLLITLLALTASAVWAGAGNGAGGHEVSIALVAHGSIEAAPQTAVAGTTVRLTVSAAEGYKLIGGSLLVEKIVGASQSDAAVMTRQGVPQVGGFVSTTKTGANTYTFIMPDTGVEVGGLFAQPMEAPVEATVTGGGKAVDGAMVEVLVADEANRIVTVDAVTIPAEALGADLTVRIPAAVTAADGQTYTVGSVASGTFYGLTGVTDVYLPDTDEPLTIGDDAFLVDDNSGSDHHVIRIHTPLALLDDYALLTALSENYEASKVQATAQAAHQYWTFSCGVDVALPDGVGLYICSQSQTDGIVIQQQKGASVIKANNGVLLASVDNAGHSYEMVARPSADRPSGSRPATYDAKSYAENLLEPVIESRHYDGGSYYILVDNAFHPISQEGADVQIPACKAVLKK